MIRQSAGCPHTTSITTGIATDRTTNMNSRPIPAARQLK